MTEPTAEKKLPRKPPRRKQPPPEADKQPRPRKEASGASKRSQKKTRELALIESGLVELLSFPAMPAAAVGDSWAVDHFTERGPSLAARVTAECERSEQFRAMVLKIVQGQSYMMLAVELGLYAVPPLLHFGIVPGAEKAGIPRLGAEKRRQAPPPTPHAPTPSAPSAPDGGERTYPSEEAAEEGQEAWEAAQEAARMNGEIGIDGEAPLEVPLPPVEPL